MHLSGLSGARAAPAAGDRRHADSRRVRGSCCTPASTKPLTAARIHKSQTIKQDAEARRLPISRRSELRWDYGTLLDDDVLLVSVTDTDGVASSRAVSRVAGGGAGRSAAGGRAAGGHRHGDHARADAAAGRQRSRRLRPGSRVVRIPSRRRPAGHAAACCSWPPSRPSPSGELLDKLGQFDTRATR